jgi:hypothetical protein
VVTPHHQVAFHAPTMKRNPVVTHLLYARCTPEKSVLPDNYSLYSQEGTLLGIAAITTLSLSMALRETCTTSLPVEVQWNPQFSKYQVVRILPVDTPITTASFFVNK